MVDAERLQGECLVVDAHTDTLQRTVMNGDDLAVRSTADPLVARADLPRYREGGVDAQIFAVWIDTIYLPHHAIRRALQQIDAFHRLLEAHPETVGLARSGEDVRRLRREGRFAALLSIEGGDAIAKDLAVLRVYHRLGACSMTLCHSRTTDWVDSSTDAAQWGGLNELGLRVIREMNRLGMVVDVTHTSDAAVHDALEISTAPVIASHSCCRTLCDHARNLSDDLLQAIAASGGVVGINFYSGFLDQTFLDRFKREHTDVLSELNSPPEVAAEDLDAVARERYFNLVRVDLPRPPFERILDHIDHAVEVAGIDHVGLGSDLDVPHLSTPEGFDDVTHFPRVTAGLIQRGYGEDDVRKILGENFLRVLDEVAERAIAVAEPLRETPP